MTTKRKRLYRYKRGCRLIRGIERNSRGPIAGLQLGEGSFDDMLEELNRRDRQELRSRGGCVYRGLYFIVLPDGTVFPSDYKVSGR